MTNKDRKNKVIQRQGNRRQNDRKDRKTNDKEKPLPPAPPP